MSEQPQGAEVDLTVILTARIKTPYGYVFRTPGSALSRMRAGLRAGDDALISPCIAYVLGHRTKGSVLIDTGLHPQAHTSLRADFGVPMWLFFRGLRPLGESYDRQLRSLGVEPDQVERVVMTHLHVDHTSGMRLLPNARFTCSTREWAATKTSLPDRRGYVRRHLPPEDRMDLVDFSAAGQAFGPFPRTIDVLGDGTVRLIDTPGHSAGHLSALVRVAGGRRVLLVGDAAYTLRSIEEGRLPMLTVDDEASTRSLEQLKAFSREDPAAILVPTHDPEAWRSLEGLATVIAGEDF